MRINKDEGLSHVAYFRTDGGSPKLYTEEFVDGLIKRIEKSKICLFYKEIITENEGIVFVVSSGKILQILKNK